MQLTPTMLQSQVRTSHVSTTVVFLSPKAELYGPWIGRRGPHVLKTTHGPLIDTALYVMILMRANPLLGQVGSGNLDCFGPQKVSRLNGWMPFDRAQKSIGFQGPTPSHLSS
jgi:hypothetical protein